MEEGFIVSDPNSSEIYHRHTIKYIQYLTCYAS